MEQGVFVSKRRKSMSLKNLKGKSFINLEDFTSKEIEELIELGIKLKKKTKNNKNLDILKGKNLVMYFAKPSLRTRLSFEIGAKKLGAKATVIKQDEIILGKRESVEDTARVISKYADAITIRTFDHDDIETFAEYSSIPVINALTDLSHPCQIMADLMTIKEKFRTFKGLKLAYSGDGNNVTNSLLKGCAKVGMDISVACPKGYEPDESQIKIAKGIAENTKSKIEILESPADAVKNADVIYADVWTSMGQEAEYEKRKGIFKDYQVNQYLLLNSKENHMVLHCLPAHKEEEISTETFEKNAEHIFNQSENRMYAQMAILASIMG